MGSLRISRGRRSREVFVIGEEQLLDEAAGPVLGERQEPQRRASESGSRDDDNREERSGPLEAALEALACNGAAGRIHFDRHAPSASAAAHPPTTPTEELAGAGLRGAPDSRAPSRPRPRLSGVAASVGIVAVLAAGAVVVTGGGDPNAADSDGG